MMAKERIKPKLFNVMKKGYSKEQFVKDVVSGIIVAIIALPLSIALALASGVQPEQGIYTAIVAGFLISFFGGSRVQISGPTAAFATIVAGIVATKGMDGLIAATLIAGAILIIMGLTHMGTLIKFIPFTITTGFTAGIAVTIVIGQLKDFFGLTYAAGVKPIETLEKLEAVAVHFGTLNIQALIVGAVSLAVLILWPRINKKIPNSLIAVIVGIAMVKLLGMPVNTIGDLYTIKAGMPAPHVPHLTLALFQDVFPDAVTIAILAAIESLLSCVVADGMINSHHYPNTELVAQGIGNIGSALFGGIPATGAIARTAANINNGGRTPIAGMVHALVLLLMLMVLMPYASMIPMPTIAAILFMVAYNMSGWRTIVRLLKSAERNDILILCATFALTVIFDLVVAIEIGMLATLILFAQRMSEETEVRGWTYYNPETDVDRTELRDIPEYVRVYEVNGPMFFGSVEQIANISLKSFTKVLVIRMRSVPSIDASAMNALEQLADRCERAGVKMVFSHTNEHPMETLKKDGFVDRIGAENFLPHIDQALDRAAEVGRQMLADERECTVC